jgi:hypothetical protein
MLLRRRKLFWSRCEDVAGSRRTQPPVDCLWSLVPSFIGLSVNSDNLSFSYVILFLLFTYVSYMHETWSWHAYRFALRFLWKNRCDTMHTMKVRTRSSLPPIHPSLSLDLTWSSQASPRKLKENKDENKKTNELGSQELAAIHPLKCLYGGTLKTKLPLLKN